MLIFSDKLQLYTEKINQRESALKNLRESARNISYLYDYFFYKVKE
jgi:hypothetical protein